MQQWTDYAKPGMMASGTVRLIGQTQGGGTNPFGGWAERGKEFFGSHSVILKNVHNTKSKCFFSVAFPYFFHFRHIFFELWNQKCQQEDLMLSSLTLQHRVNERRVRCRDWDITSRVEFSPGNRAQQLLWHISWMILLSLWEDITFVRIWFTRAPWVSICAEAKISTFVYSRSVHCFISLASLSKSRPCTQKENRHGKGNEKIWARQEQRWKRLNSAQLKTRQSNCHLDPGVIGVGRFMQPKSNWHGKKNWNEISQFRFMWSKFLLGSESETPKNRPALISWKKFLFLVSKWVQCN